MKDVEKVFEYIKSTNVGESGERETEPYKRKEPAEHEEDLP